MADVSVIIAAYNVEAYIERALRSALGQSGVEVEIIVVDDGSTDGTVAVARSINDPRIKVIELSGNSGPAAARNAGFAAATAPWLAVLDGDDALAEGRLARCLRRAKITLADIVVDNLEVCSEADGTKAPMFEPIWFARILLLDLATFIRGNYPLINRWTLGYLKPVFSVAFLRQHGLRYDPAIPIGEDYMLLAEALASGARCAIEPATGYLYTQRKGSASYRTQASDFDPLIAGVNRFAERYRLDPLALKAQKGLRFWLREKNAYAALVAALKARAWGQTVAIIANRPSAALHLWQPLWARLRRAGEKQKPALAGKET